MDAVVWMYICTTTSSTYCSQNPAYDVFCKLMAPHGLCKWRHRIFDPMPPLAYAVKNNFLGWKMKIDEMFLIVFSIHPTMFKTIMTCCIIVYTCICICQYTSPFNMLDGWTPPPQLYIIIIIKKKIIVQQSNPPYLIWSTFYRIP